MSCLADMQAFVQEYAETIAEVLELEVTIADENLIRIGGTGQYALHIGQALPCGCMFQTIMQTGGASVIEDGRNRNACASCEHVDECKELATMGFPIFNGEKTIGVIGLIALTEEQHKKIIESSSKLMNFLKHMSSLLQSKIQLMEANQKLQLQVQEAFAAINKKYSFMNIITRDAVFLEVLNKARKISSSYSTVIIRGESGTGKELLARAIHGESQRRQKPFIAVNCASIPENLLESELFGYEEGAFTGAKKDGKPGKFELANTGTIFLDEIGDMPLSIQPKLLRVIQERSIDRVGGKKAVAVDVRIIAATNKNLEEMVERGVFREDLYYRLNVIPLFIPPLSARKGDIPLYVEYFVNKYSALLKKDAPEVGRALLQCLCGYHWPGNVRQLENVVEYMVNMSQNAVIELEDLPENLVMRRGSELREAVVSLEDRLADFEKTILKGMLAPGMTTQEKNRAAQELGISVATLYRKLERHGLSK